jgi:murein DD-endopeptidase MepM/ murein hydrolase activator NlpD
MNDSAGGATTAVAAAMLPAGGRRRRLRRWALAVAAVFVLSLAWPDHPALPVQGATRADWNPRSFWYYPWGASGVHKGIDIFAPDGRPVAAATSGVVIRSGLHGAGGNMIAVLGPRWRIHYYAHLSRLDVAAGEWVWRGEVLGAVGSTGNAAGKPPHLHYAIITAVPYPWRITAEPQGWQKMFFLDPGAEFAD